MKRLGQMFRNVPVRGMLGRSGAWDGASYVDPIQDDERAPSFSGLTAGTQVVTETGWRNVEALQVGDKVLTFDAGFQTVRRVNRGWSYLDHAVVPQQSWPLRVPKASLGNNAEMTLLPEQSVMVESDSGEALYGDPFTLIPAAALDGYKGISRVHPDQPLETIGLEFDTEQVIFANDGALFHCPPPAEMSIVSLLEDHPVPGYAVLSLSQAREFIAALIDEDTLDAAWMQQERQARQVKQIHPVPQYAL